jgi:hypothetical protein
LVRPGCAQVDIRFGADLFGRVYVIRRLIALALLALWLPATLHCDVEAAGFDDWFGCHEEAASTKDHCTEDVCQALEGFAYKSDAALLKVSPPPPGFCSDCLISLSPPFPRLATDSVNTGTELPWSSRPWQFAHRAAPPARAPACIV